MSFADFNGTRSFSLQNEPSILVPTEIHVLLKLHPGDFLYMHCPVLLQMSNVQGLLSLQSMLKEHSSQSLSNLFPTRGEVVCESAVLVESLAFLLFVMKLIFTTSIFVELGLA